MKHIYYSTLLLFTLSFAFAQNTVNISASSTWNGFMNVFETDQTTYAFGSAWAVADLKTELDTGANTVTLKPNYNTYANNPTDPYWVNQTTGDGNKYMDASTYVESSSLWNAQDLTVQGEVTSNTLDAAYTATVFIKVLDPDNGYATIYDNSIALPASGNFSVMASAADLPAGKLVQYGFQVKGINANPADEATLGSVVVTGASNPPAGTQMDLPVTFEDSTVDYGLAGFGGAEDSSIVANPDTNVNTSATVAKVVKSATAELWAGTTVTAPAQLGFATAIPFTSTDTKMNVMVWSPDANIPVRLKVEDHTDPTKSVETEAMTTVANQWEVLEFDFSMEATGTAALNLSYTYDKASIFFNFGTDGATAGEKTYYFDDMKFGPDNMGVEDIQGMGNEVNIYPNPVQNGGALQVSKEIQSVEIFDLNGKLVQKEISNSFQINQPKGVYLVKITETNGNSTTKKIVVR